MNLAGLDRKQLQALVTGIEQQRRCSYPMHDLYRDLTCPACDNLQAKQQGRLGVVKALIVMALLAIVARLTREKK